jgi:hypothetical protein
MNIKSAINFTNDSSGFKVTYNSPTRKFKDLREEFNNDALTLGKEGPVYISFSAGVDSQIIARCFIDMKIDAEFVFLYIKNHNEQEYQQVIECEKYWGISVKKIELDLKKFKTKWIKDNQSNPVDSLVQYPFLYLSSQLEESWPIVTQGKSEPALVGINPNKIAVYHNFYEAMELRFNLMNRYRTVYDFPFSPEAIASYYTDDNMKTFASTIKYFGNNNLQFEGAPVQYNQYYNTYAKPFVKGKYFKNDILWFSKLTGAEKYPDWLLKMGFSPNTRVSVPYWDLVNFLSNELDSSKDYKDWIFAQ